MRQTEFDVLVSGAGPAGSVLAMRLARRGLRVALLDKARFPREKLCGAFLSPDGAAHLSSLGFKENALREKGAVPLSHYRLASGKAAAEGDFDGSAAYGFPRAALDAMLFEAAAKAGAEALDGVRVEHAQREGGTWNIRATALASGKALALRARAFADASGRMSPLSPPRADGKWAALSVDLEGVAWETPHLAMAFFAGGYGGVLPTGVGVSHACFLFPQRLLKEADGNFGEIWKRTMSPSFPRAKFLTDSWKAAANLSFGMRRAVEGVFPVGDAACALDPFAGDGVSFALESAALAENFVVRVAEGDKTACGEYRVALWRALRMRVFLGNALRPLAVRSAGSRALVRALAAFPAAHDALFRRTRGALPATEEA